MKTTNYFVDANYSEFSIESFEGTDGFKPSLSIKLKGKGELKFRNPEDIDELCQIIQEKKNNVWKT